MLGKEFGRFTGSANYMLNCGLGTLLLLISGVLLLLRGGVIAGTLESVFETDGAMPVLLTAAVCLVCSMNDMAVPKRVARRQDALDLPVAARRRMDGAARQMRRAAPPHRAGCGLCRRMLGDRSSRRICRRTSHGALLRGVRVLLDVFRAVHRSAQCESCLDE